ncbi:hypothetical protein KKB54_01655 [bacterium]|nr:hypothetical protein [bacterium]MBU0899509.1 hypothetical protein [bacterium]MBU1153457.1 hypothetical protein [bacterium]MBU1782685.1 hypothetical protein [bacterium]
MRILDLILYLFFLFFFFMPLKGKASLINFTPDQPEYIEKFTNEIIQATNLSLNTEKVRFFINIAYKRLQEAVNMSGDYNYAYLGELVKAYQNCLALSINIYNNKIEVKGEREEILSLLEKCLFKSIVDLTYLLRNSPKEYRETVQRSLDYTLSQKNKVEKIMKKLKEK